MVCNQILMVIHMNTISTTNHYSYIIGAGDSAHREHKFNYRKARFRDDPNLLWRDGATESELARLNGLPRVWDAGKTRWVMEVG